jgi:hypothetical protein
MTQKEQTILDKRITGLTWGVVLTMATTAGGGISIAFKGYVNIVTKIDRTYYDNRNLEQKISNVKEVTDRHEQQIQMLMRERK